MRRRNALVTGFTLIELLIAIGIIGILSSIVIVAINPGKILPDTKDAKRQRDLNTILNASYQYYLDTDQWPVFFGAPVIAVDTPVEVCSVTETTDDDYFNCIGAGKTLLGTFVPDYLASMPIDPDHDTENDPLGTGYFIWRDDNNRLYLNAPLSDAGDDLEVSR